MLNETCNCFVDFLLFSCIKMPGTNTALEWAAFTDVNPCRTLSTHVNVLNSIKYHVFVELHAFFLRASIMFCVCSPPLDIKELPEE